ncbi:MAG TPA: ComEC/Rec2 family competence protein [Verrucomicrobiae bacterium]
MNRPLAAVVLAYAAGLLLAQLFCLPLDALFVSSFFVLFLVLVLKKLRLQLIWLLLIFAGWTNLETRTAVVSPNDLRAQLGNRAAIVTVRGKLAETPHLKIIEQDDQEKWHSVVRVRVSEIRRDENFSPASGEIIVSTPDVLAPEYFAGQPVQISGVIAPPPPPLAEGLFDYQNYLATRGIYYELKTSSTNDWKLLEPHRLKPPLTDRFLNWAKGTLALGLPAEDKPLRLLWAMTLGWRTAFTGDISEPFLRAGTMHMFAIDGLRIALLSGMIVTLLRVLRLSRAWCGAIAVPTIWFYTAATGWEPSAIRASVMMTVVLGGWALKRPGDLLNSLAAAAFVILVWEPRQLFEASFQLSFFVVLIIALMLPPLNEFFDRVLRQDSMLPDELLPRWKKVSLWFSQKFARYCGLSFAAWIGSLPLSAKYFHLFSPVSTLANIFAVPLGTLALMANLGALICGHWLPWFTELFNNAAWFFMVAMTWVSAEFTKIPGSYFYVHEPSLATIAIFYAVVIAIFTGWFSNSRRKFIGAAILLFIGGVYFWQWQSSRDETDLTVLPLNGGHAVFVDAAGRKNDWLINCGNENAVQFTLKDFLRAHGVNTIPRLVLTEGDAKNCGGAELLDQLFGVGELWTSSAKFRSTAYRNAVAKFDDGGSLLGGRPQEPQHKIMNCGDTIGCWQVLFPASTNGFSRADDSPLVLRGDFHGTRILLLADLSRAGQNELLSRTNDLRADIVVAGLPNDDEPLCDALIDAVQPRVIVIADSEFPATRRASRALHERLTQKKIPVIYTRTSGAAKIVTDQSGWELRTMDGQEFQSR